MPKSSYMTALKRPKMPGPVRPNPWANAGAQNPDLGFFGYDHSQNYGGVPGLVAPPQIAPAQPQAQGFMGVPGLVAPPQSPPAGPTKAPFQNLGGRPTAGPTKAPFQNLGGRPGPDLVGLFQLFLANIGRGGAQGAKAKRMARLQALLNRKINR